MTSPTKEYTKKSELVRKLLDAVDLSVLETKFECSRKDLPKMAQLPDFVGFYSNNKRIGQLYFLKDPMELVKLDSSFEPYAKSIEEELGL